jgi:membrane fusion protein, multidrug efflux system
MRLPVVPLRKLLLGGLALVAIVFAVKSGARWVLDGRFMVETDDAYVEADTTIVAPEAVGTVTEVLVVENARVQPGDVLVRLADADARARLVQAESAVATFKAAYANTEARLNLQQTMIRGAEAALASARSDRIRTAADHDRYTRLHNDRITSAQRYEAARSEAEKGQAAFDKANAGLDAERQQMAVLATQRDQAAAQIAQSAAQVELARIDLARTVIRAPVAGVVGNRGVQVGQYVRPGTQLMAIVPIPLVRVVANFKETQISGLKRGQPVQIHTDAWPDVRIVGRVESLAPASGSRFSILPPENATGNFTKIVQRVPVRISVDPANALAGRLRPGLSVIVTIDSRGKGEGEHADLLVPPPAANAANRSTDKP